MRRVTHKTCETIKTQGSFETPGSMYNFTLNIQGVPDNLGSQCSCDKKARNSKAYNFPCLWDQQKVEPGIGSHIKHILYLIHGGLLFITTLISGSQNIPANDKPTGRAKNCTNSPAIFEVTIFEAIKFSPFFSRSQRHLAGTAENPNAIMGSECLYKVHKLCIMYRGQFPNEFRPKGPTNNKVNQRSCAPAMSWPGPVNGCNVSIARFH